MQYLEACSSRKCGQPAYVNAYFTQLASHDTAGHDDAAQLHNSQKIRAQKLWFLPHKCDTLSTYHIQRSQLQDDMHILLSFEAEV